jgi:hypothetical protein
MRGTKPDKNSEKSEKTPVYAQKHQIKLPFSNSISGYWNSGTDGCAE